jgi:hypothetical protein
MKISLLITCYNGNYNEIIDYMKQKHKNINIILYNKKNKDFGIPVKNVGVDAYDKLHFIINNYDDLPDIVLFSTDNMFSNNKKKKKIKYIIDNLNILKNKSGFISGHIFPIPKNEITFEVPIYTRNNTKNIRSTIRPYYKWFNTFINKDIDLLDTYICKKSTFAVTKDLILSNSKEFYIELLEEVEKHSIKGHDSEVPHFFEMAYVEMFCKNDISKMFHDSKTYGLVHSVKNNPNY